MTGDLISFLHFGLAHPLANVGLVSSALAAGAASMAIYAIVSPQQKLTELERALAEVRSSMVRYEGDFGGAVLLIRLSLTLALRRVGLTIAPALIAGLPILIVLSWTDAVSMSGMWRSGDGAAFLSLACLSALAVKLLFRIK